MEVLSQEVVTFGDMYCQMHDLVRPFLFMFFALQCRDVLVLHLHSYLPPQVKPDVSNVITSADLRRCGQAATFLNAW